MTRTIHDQVLAPSEWTVTGIDADGKATLALYDITKPGTRQELAGYFTEQTYEQGAICGHATCLADPSVVLYFGVDEAAVIEHMDWHQSMQATHGGGRPSKRPKVNGFG